MSTVPVEWTRPSDADRDRALSVLRDGAGSGRLSHDTFVRRMNLVLRARTHGELADVLRDLPRTESRLAAWTRSVREKLPRLAIDRPGGGLAARSVAGVRSARRSGSSSRRGAAWRAVLPRLSVVREVPAPPPPALALAAPGSPTVRIGRGLGATLRLADISVSRFHAELRYVGEDWMLRDLGSMNGTFVNGHRITTTVCVRPGDQISFGAVAFTLTSR